MPERFGLELFFVEVNSRREFSFGSWPTRLHCMLRAGDGTHSGWSEICLPLGNDSPETVMERVAAECAPWRGLSVAAGLQHTIAARGKISDGVLEAIEMALIDLDSARQGISALSYLGLNDFTPVPGLVCILQKEIAKAVDLARSTARTHLKLKLFGEIGHDTELISAVRKVIPPGCFLAGDVNMGYGRKTPHQELTSQIVDAMRRLRAAGLDACEDPANLCWSDWEVLQRQIPDLALIPDEPMRPAYHVLETVHPVPGHIYNLHPGCMGSLTATVALARHLTAHGAGVMIGDNSLVGAACSAWQQIAGGVGAKWCEALEKPEESAIFPDCVLACATRRRDDGFCELKKEARPGFGLEVDCRKLAAASIQVCRI